MGASKPNATVCGIPATLGGPIRFGAGGRPTKLDPAGGFIGTHRAISKPGAKRLVQALFGPNARLPRSGQQLELCSKQFLVNQGGFDIYRYDTGEIAGARKRRKRSRR